jgi:hypothetical protein
MRALILSILSIVAVAASTVLHAATFDYEAHWDWYPEQFTAGMVLFNDSPTEAPILAGGALTINNDVAGEHIYYTLSGSNLAMPTDLWGEAEVRVIRNRDTSGGKRTASELHFTTSDHVGNILWLGVNEIFISYDEFTHGAGAYVDTTTNFHTYRVEVDGNPIYRRNDDA